MSARHRALVLFLLLSLLAAGCGVAQGPATPMATPVAATATRIRLEATGTPLSPTATAAPQTATATPLATAERATAPPTPARTATMPPTPAASPVTEPAPPPVPSVVEALHFQSGHFELAGDLQLPAGEGMHPAIIMVHGDGSINRTDSGKYRPIMERFLRAGYAVFSWDKPGTGESTGAFADGAWIITDRASILVDAVRFLRVHPSIDPLRIGVWGISQGGIVIPMALTMSDDIAFVIVVSGPGVDGIDQTAYLIGQKLRCEGYPEEDAKLAEQSFAGLCKATTYEEYRENKAGLIRFPSALIFTDREILPEAEWAAWDRGVDAFFDPIQVIRQTTLPVLAFFGEKDTQVDPFQGALAYEGALQQAGNRNYRVELIPGVDHSIVRCESGCMAARDRRSSAEWLNYAPEYLDLMEAWLVQLSESEEGSVRLSADELATLHSLTQVDGYPLYVMHYGGDYREYTGALRPAAGATAAGTWGCSLFAALGDPNSVVYGRNFDWQYSPALLLFTDPPDGYASVSMQSVRFMGSYGVDATDLTNTTLEERYMLLYTPIRPYDGMNEAGLAIGMAAVPSDGTRHDPAKEDINMFTMMREVLDSAASVNEAVEVIGRYNILMEGGPPVHYLVADASGQAVLVEFYEGEMVVIPNEQNWHAATNFFLIDGGDHPEDQCSRYESIATSLADASGQCSAAEAMALLDNAAQASTQWSVVYNLSTRDIEVVVGGHHETVHTFRLGK